MRRLLTGAACLSAPGGVVALPGGRRLAVAHLHAPAGSVTAATAGLDAVVLTLGPGLGHALLQSDVETAQATARAVQQVAARRLPRVLITVRPEARSSIVPRGCAPGPPRGSSGRGGPQT